jgi:hypothetical protein
VDYSTDVAVARFIDQRAAELAEDEVAQFWLAREQAADA